MSWKTRYALKSYILPTMWIAPLVAFLIEQFILRAALIFNLEFDWFPRLTVDEAGQIAAADYVIGSSLSFIVFTFSSLLVAIQVSSGQLTPRIIATALLRDRVIRWSVGLFTFVLLLAVAVKMRNATVPNFLISLMSMSALLSVLAFMFLIDYASRLLRPVTIVWRISKMGMQVIENVYPEPYHEKAPPPPSTPLLPSDLTILHRGTSSIVVAINVRALIAEATRTGCVIEFVPQVGDFVAVGEPLFELRGPGASLVNVKHLRDQVAFGRERTIEQDSTFAFRIVVDIALKALSAAINDPTTAVLALDQLQRLLRTVGRRELRSERIYDDEGQLRLILPTPNWEDFVDLSFTEIRHCGGGTIQVVRRLRATIETLIEGLPESRRQALRAELELLDQTIEDHFTHPKDKALARVTDTQGMGGAHRPMAA